MNQIKMGLVTVLYNSNSVLPDFFESHKAQSFKNYMLYFVDNSPNNESAEMIKQFSAANPTIECKHILSGGNIGVAAGNNLGIKAALNDHCSHIVLLNNDIKIESNTFYQTLAQQALTEKIVATKVLYFDNKKIWMAGGYLNKWRALGIHFGMHKDADLPEYNASKYITYAPTCFMLIAAEVFKDTGLMDEKYFAYYDDVDFCLQAINQGYKIKYEPSLTVLHKVSSSSGGDNSPFYIYYGNRNKIYFIRKNLKGLHFIFSILLTLMTRTIYYLKFDSEKSKILRKGIRDGFKLKISK